MRNSNFNIHQNLLDRCLEGDQKAQFEIYRLYYKSMYNSCLRIVSVPEEAEDIMQESFLAAFHKLKSYNKSVSFGAWLKRIVINKSLDTLRKRKTLFETLNPELPITEEAELEPVSLSLEEVKNAIKTLPDGYRMILSLILIEGYNYDEASAILKIKNVTCRTQFLRAKLKIREAIIENKKKNKKVEQHG